MSFLNTLQALGLFPGAQGGQAGPQAASPPQGGPQAASAPPPAPAPSQNPYGATDEDMRMARFQALSSIGTQMMALGQQMTPQQRAVMLARADFTGGIGENLANAAQQRLAMRKAQREDTQYQREEEARTKIGEQIKALPPGPLKQAATYFFTAGDLGKAGELLWTTSEKFDPLTGQNIRVDALGNPIGAAPSLTSGPLPGGGGGSASVPGSPPAGPAAAPGPSPADAPAAGGDGPVDQLTTNWRALLQDPSLTPQEARIISSQGSREKALDAYQTILTQRQTAASSAASQSQTALSNNRTGAEALTSKFAEQTKSYDTIIGAGQRAAQVATSPQMSASAKLSTLYQFMKALDPDGAVREGDVAMAQAMQSIKDQWLQFAEAQINGGGPISDQMVMDMAREMARLANDAAGRKEAKRLQMVKLAQGRQIPTEMVSPDLNGGSQNMQAPIGLNIPAAAPRNAARRPIPVEAARELQSDPSPEARAEFDQEFGPGAADRVLSQGGN